MSEEHSDDDRCLLDPVGSQASTAASSDGEASVIDRMRASFSVGSERDKDFVRARLFFEKVSLLVDQGLDAAVMIQLVELHHWPHLAAVMGVSIIAPQVIAWWFLRLNKKATRAGLLRTLFFPLVGTVVLVALWASKKRGATFARHAALACIPLSVETLVLFCQGMAAGRILEGSLWSWLAEGLLEAPASAALALYSAMLTSANTDSSADALCVVSFLFSLLMIAKASTRLHFYGTRCRARDFAYVMFLEKLPQVISQILGFTFFAFMTRPLPKEGANFDAELEQTDKAWPVFVLLMQEVLLNVGTLLTVSPSMSKPVLVLLATTMVVASPPGFLSALDSTRFGHALQHLLCQALVVAWAVWGATPVHWEVLCTCYWPFVALYAFATPWAFAAAIVPKRTADAHAGAAARLDNALLDKDRIMAKLLIDVEQVTIRDGPIKGLDFVDTGKGQGGMKCWGVADCGGLAIFCPDFSTDIMILDPVDLDLAFASTKRFQYMFKWQGVAYVGGLAVFCPGNAAEVMLLDPESTEVTFVDTGRKHGGRKWCGVAEVNGLAVFGPNDAAEIMLLDPASRALTFVDTGKGQGGTKWCGVANVDGLAVFCPSGASEIMIFDPASQDVSFVDTRRGRGGLKWSGVVECGGLAVFCPCEAADVMILDPVSKKLTFVDTGRGHGGVKWVGVAAWGDLVVFCPCEAADIMLMDPTSKELTFVGTGSGPGGMKWSGVAVVGGLFMFAPRAGADIMVMDPSSKVLRKDRCRELGLLE